MSDSSTNHNLTDFYDADITIHDHLNEERYIDYKLIGTGSFKEVYQVFDTHCSREVAYSTLKQDLLSPENAIDFVREIQITSGFEHPNIIRIYDVGIKEDCPWFTMELSSGRTLTNLLESRNNIQLSEKLDLFIQLCDAVHYAHQHDVIHLDLKPDNINIDKHDQVLLADWGIASSICKLPEADLMKDSSQPHYIKGSLGYMAPEQAVPNYQKYPSTDIFGLGGVLFFLLTGEAPIPASDQKKMLENTKAGVIKELNRPDIPPRLVPLLSKALSKKPNDRYSTAAAMQSEVQAFRNGFATNAESASAWMQIKLFCQRNKALSVTLILSLLTLISLTSYYIHSIQHSESKANHSRSVAEKQKQQAEEQKIIAQQALQQVIETEDRRKKTNEAFSNILFKYAQGQMSDFDFNAALKTAKSAVKRDPNNLWALRRVGVIHFIRQELDKAYHYLERSQDLGFIDLQQIALKEQNKGRPLPVNDLIDIFDQIPKRLFLRLCMVKFDASLRSPKAHSELVANLLKQSKKLDTLNFRYYPKNKTLDLTGNPTLKSTYIERIPQSEPTNIITSLPILRLILDDTSYNRENAENHFRPNSNCKIIFKK